MKKLFLILAIMACGLYSCTKQALPEPSEKEVVQKNMFEYTMLRTALSEYTSGFNLDPYLESRRGGFWRRLCGIFGADGNGAALGREHGGFWGALFWGIGNSLLYAVLGEEFLIKETVSVMDRPHVCVYRTPVDTTFKYQVDYASFPVVKPIDIQLLSNSSPDLDKEISDVDNTMKRLGGIRKISFEENSFGYLHNDIIAELYENDKDLLDNSIPVLIDKVAECMENRNIQITEQMKSELEEQLSKKDVGNCEDLENTMQGFKEDYPEYLNIFEVIQDFVENASSCKSESQLDKYVRGYLDIVIKSELPQKDKDMLVAAIEVSSNSILLWSIK